MPATMHRHDVLILGSGLAALTVALKVADTRRVAIVTKRRMTDGASDWAQGGIAAAVDAGDSVDAHVRDTMNAGAGLCDEAATRLVASRAAEMITWLTANGVAFTPDPTVPGGLHLAREGGHSTRRVVHATDATGHAVQTSLLEKVRAHPNIDTFEQHVAIDLITGKRAGGQERQIHGAYALNKGTDEVETFAAGHTVLTTGGAGKVYLYTTNPDTSTGDGIAMAWRAGARVANLEMVQFHPTCLYHPHAKSFLITEAVRGEGGYLRLPDGTRFMSEHDPRGELASRDIVARAIDFEMKKRGIDCVYLDITHKPAEFVREHFPTIYRRCLELGIDITSQPIPVVPAAHYTCGGVVTDLNARTDLCNLHAVGEVTFTGLHGANRLASNSLLECLVFGHAAAADILATPAAPDLKLPRWDESRVTDPDEEVVISHNWDELRRFMWDYVGIVRTNKRLARAAHRIRLLRAEIDEFYRNFRVSNDLIELRNLVQTADLIIRSAQLRQESRGLHFSRDFPDMLPIAGNTVLNPRPGLLCPGVCGMPSEASP
jgi:L-aspartate oxidase